jgi:hypothetical protein
MGRKSISNRMPKKSRPFTSVDIRGLARGRFGEHTGVQSPRNSVETLLNRDSLQPLTGGSNKTQKDHS